MITMFEKDWVSTFSFFCQENLIENVINFFLAHQALDVYLVPVTGKQLFGYEVHILCLTDQEGYFSKLLAENFTTEFKVTRQTRYKLSREFKKIEIANNPVIVKCSYTICNGKKHYFQLKPEYEDCKRIAQLLNRPLREIYQATIKKARASLNSEHTPFRLETD